MPGINFIVDFKKSLKDQTTKITQAQKSLLHTDWYFNKTLLFNKNYFLGFSKYNSYPLATFEDNRFLVCLEGKIYNKNNQTIRKEIKKLAENIFSFNANSKAFIQKWLLDSDGDYIVLILDKVSKEVAIINDALGRLPLYFCKTDTKFFVSREIKFITPFVKKIEFDRMAIAECLLFGYSLGEKTLLRNVYRLQPATLIRINPLKSVIKIDNIYTFNFENKKYKEKSLQDNANQLKRLFLESCKNRANCMKKCRRILSLSGGLDSRAVGVGLQKNSILFSGATFLDFQKTAELDAKFARQIAKMLNIGWRLLKLGPTKGKDILRLLRMKDGLNHLGMSFILSFFDKIKKIYGSRIIYFTGDEGNRLFNDFTHGVKLRNLDELIDHLAQKNCNLKSGAFSLEETEFLTGVNKKAIINEIKKHIQKYPENDLNQKCIHFDFEGAFKWAFEGEDRNRHFFWSAAPFYSLPFFDYIMNCPDEQKKYFKLQQKFLSNLSPQISAITNVNWGFSILSNKFYLSQAKSLIKSLIYYKFPWRIQINIKKKNTLTDKKYQCGQVVKDCMLEQITACHSVREYFSEIELKRFIEKKFNLSQFHNLLTIISYIELIKCDLSTLEKYTNSNFFV